MGRFHHLPTVELVPLTISSALSFALVLALAAAPVRAESGNFPFRKVALAGEPMPGIEGDARFRWFGGAPGLPDAVPMIDASGNVSFSAGWTPQALPHGVFRENAGTLEKIAAVGDLAPGTAVTFEGFPDFLPGAPRIVAGAVSFDASVTPDQFQEDGVWTDRSGPLELVFLASNQPPGTPAGSTFFQWFHTMRGPGHIVVNARYATGSSSEINDHGFWRDSTGELEVVALARTPAPGTEAGTVFGNGTSLNLGVFQNWDLDDQGHVAFNAMVMGPAVDELDDEGIWNEGPGGLALVVREGSSAPGLGGGARFLGNNGFRTFGHEDVLGVVKDENNHLLFGARVRDPGSDNRANAVYTTRNGGLELVTFGRFPGSNPPGEPAPGFPPGSTFTRFIEGRMNDLGTIAVSAAVDTGGGVLAMDSGVWWDRRNGLELVVRPGQPAPGLPEGTVFGFSLLGPLTNEGELVLLSAISGPIGNRTGLFVADAGGEIHLLARTGQLFEVAQGDQRTIGEIGLGQGAGNGLELVLDLEFTDGTAGIFTVHFHATAGAGEPLAAAPAQSFRQAAPNPFGKETLLRYELARAGHVRLEIYDVAGRRVATLVDRGLPAGRHGVTWSGTNDLGIDVASGVYFARLVGAGGGESPARILKLQLVR